MYIIEEGQSRRVIDTLQAVGLLNKKEIPFVETEDYHISKKSTDLQLLAMTLDD